MSTTTQENPATAATNLAIKSLDSLKRLGTPEQIRAAEELAGVVAAWAKRKGVAGRPAHRGPRKAA